MRQEGARLILWPEGAIMAMKEDEQRYRQLAADFARENNITSVFLQPYSTPIKLIQEAHLSKTSCSHLDQTAAC
ncbi:MAG: hypothetical protein H6561_20010 [Lewinellaceae bacterium]|nr:hypothetical protein [Lewinellaceae bacterium]